MPYLIPLVYTKFLDSLLQNTIYFNNLLIIHRFSSFTCSLGLILPKKYKSTNKIIFEDSSEFF